ncbi:MULTISPECIES: hypothetical protein [Roseomonadaceae]|uniref:Uncharacterized protein n=1 Tax=Falsiroseomonas oleicola TaxID=2801474 RepID=A0ABS6HC13_9PROT|nr:hypothetical protein [Roseomonas oleicola]MBU8545021.1 hypothetical protein [Roseomonas oleicola]
MILRMAAGGVLGAVMVAGAVGTLAVGAGVVGSVLLARRLCEERKGWQAGADAGPEETPMEAPMEPEPGASPL